MIKHGAGGKMYTAIVCDDDEIITQGIASFIPWKKIGIELCGIAYDGTAARKLIDEHHPDILVSDVCMPGASGIELTRYAKQQNNDTQAIIISGYDNFRYAQEAIRAEASNYLLKPIDEDELIECLKKCVSILQQKEVGSTLKIGNILYKKSEILSFMNEGEESYIQIHGIERLQQVSNVCIGLWTAEIDDYLNYSRQLSETECRRMLSILDECIEDCHDHAIEFEKFAGTVSFYVLAESRKECQNIGENVIAKCRKKIAAEYDGHTVTSVRSEIHADLLQMQMAREELRIAQQNRFNYPAASDIVYSQDINSMQNTETQLIHNESIDTSAIVSSIIRWNKHEVDRELEDMRKSLLANGGKSYLYMRLMTAGLFGSLLKELRKMGVDEEALGLDPKEQYRRISGAGNLNEAISMLRENVYSIIDQLEQDQQHKNKKLVYRAKQYIEEHHMDHDLSLEQVAHQVHISPSYFSVLFKNEEGIAFTDYLIRIRIQRACDLMMNTDLKAYEIAEKVGYDTPAYYSTAFKKVMGLSPTEYKKMSMQKGTSI